MRCLSLLLSAAFLFTVPAMAADTPATTTPPVPPAAASAPAAAAAKAASPATAPAETVSSKPAGTSAAAAAPVPVSSFSDAQRAEIENIFKEYITKKNPEVLMEAMQELQKREMTDAANKSKTALTNDHDKLYNDAMSPIGGNPKGSVIVVEFFDYACGYCKMSEPHVEKLLKENKDVKFIYKDYPILGPASTEAAKAALAANKQGKYVQMHDKLMTAQIPHGASEATAADDAIFKAAKEAGVDVEKLKKDMKDDAIDKALEANVSLGMEVGARGTPTFIIGDSVYPGAMEYDQLKKTVADAAGKPPAIQKP